MEPSSSTSPGHEVWSFLERQMDFSTLSLETFVTVSGDRVQEVEVCAEKDEG